MSALLEAVAKARDQRAASEEAFRAALRRAKRTHSWAELAGVAHLSLSGVRWLVHEKTPRERKNDGH